MMPIELPEGYLSQARYCESPNQDARPPGMVIDLLVIHGISLPPREFGGPWIEDLFCNRLDPNTHPYFATIHTLRVSAHVLIRRDGSMIQFVPFSRRAWHAGESCFQGRSRCNDFSIGVELEGTDEWPYDDRQYATLAKVVCSLQQHYPAITPQRITSHAAIAPGRKTDPGAAFDWQRLFAAH